MKKYLIGGGVLLAIIVLLGWGKIFDGTAEVKFWKDTQVACLPRGHENLAMHIHQNLVITVDGVPETIPANVGIDAGCMAEAHTHDATGKIHVESTEAGKAFTLGDFFAVWGKPFERDGYARTVTVNGVLNESPALIPFEDDQQIVFTYVSAKTSIPITP